MANENIREVTTPETEEAVVLTAEEHQAKADEILAKIGEFCAASVSAWTNPQHTPSYEDIGKELTKLVERYNFNSESAKLRQIATSDDPALEAVKILAYTKVSVSERVTDLGGGILRSYQFKTSSKRLDLLKCSTYCKQQKVTFGKAPDWYPTIEKFCCVLTLEHAKALGIPATEIATIDASFLMSKIARDVQLAAEDPEHPNPLSKTQMSKNLTLILTKLIGDAYHADTRDAAFTKMCFAGQGRDSLSVKTANVKRLLDLVLQIAYRSVFDKSYAIQAAVRKEKG